MTNSARRASEAQQIGVLVWGLVAAKASRALVPLLIVRMLGQGDVGLLATMMLVYETIAVLLVAGFPRSIQYFHAGRTIGERRAITERLTAVMLAGGLIVAALLGVVGLLGVPALHAVAGYLFQNWGYDLGPTQTAELVIPMLPWLGGYAIFDVPSKLGPNLMLAEGRARSSAAISLLSSVGNMVGTLVPAALGFGVSGILAGQFAFGLVSFALFAGAAHTVYRGVRSEHGPVSWRDLFAVSVPLGATDIVITLNGSVDRWLIALFFTRREVAQYEIGAWQIPIVTNIAYSVGAVYLRRLTELYRESKPLEALAIWRQSITKVSLIVVPAAAMFFVAAEDFVTLLFTDEYARAATVFQAYCLMTMARVTAFGSMITASGGASNVLRAAGLSLVFNVVISIPLVMTIGFNGPAIGTVIAFVPTVIVYCHYIARGSGVPLSQTFPLASYLRVVATVAAPAAAAMWFRTLVPTWHDAARFGAVGLIVLGGFALLGSASGQITRDDWRFVRDWLRLRVLR